MQVITLIMIIIALIEVIEMNDPKITSYARPLSAEDRDELGDINFDNFDYMMGFSVDIINPIGILIGRPVYHTLPADVGRIIAQVWDNPDDSFVYWDDVPQVSLVDCSEFLEKETIQRSISDIR